MPHAVLRLAPTVNTTETPALNENQGVSLSNLIRFQPDTAAGTALIQKLGGWLKFFPSTMAAIVRALWAWEDLNEDAWLALGTQQLPSETYSQLAVIESGTLTDITPVQVLSLQFVTSFAFTPTIGSPSILVDDVSTTGVTNAVSVYLATQIAVGGIILFGEYNCDPDGYVGTGYTIYARDILGNLTPATSTAAAQLPIFYTTAGSRVITVQLNNGSLYYVAGNTFPILVEANVGGLTLSGNYIIQQNVDADHFTIIASAPATTTSNVQLAGGDAIFVYNGLGNIPNGVAKIGTIDWTIDNFGEDLIACPTSSSVEVPLPGNPILPYQPIYIWNPNAQQPTAIAIPQAPPVNDGVFVAMPQRQIVAWGSTQTGIQDPLLINWCDVNNPYQWIALATNQAGSYRIPKGSRIVGGLQAPQLAFVWTDIDVWSMQYIGPPLVYSFNQIGTGCGLIGRKAAACFNGAPYWMSYSQFYTYAADGVQPIPCPVWDVVFQNINTSALALSKIRTAVNSRFGEIAWYYCSAGSNEVDSYVKLNVYLGLWDYGSLARSAWIDQSVLGPPIGADPNSLYLYQHETSNDADGTAMMPFFQTGYGAIAEGDFKAFVDLVWPDMRWGMWDAAQNATVSISFYCADYPGDTPTVYGPYTVTQAVQFFNTRLRARLMAVRISSDDLGSFWRIGSIRYRWAQDGRF